MCHGLILLFLKDIQADKQVPGERVPQYRFYCSSVLFGNRCSGASLLGAEGTGQPHLARSLSRSEGEEPDLLSPSFHCCIGGGSPSCHHLGPHFPHRDLEQSIPTAPRLKASGKGEGRCHKAACFFPCVGRRLAQCCFSNH